MKKKPLVIANWKMNPSILEKAKNIFQKINRRVDKLKNVSVVVAPASLHLATLSKLKRSRKLSLAVQNVHWKEQGSHTGETGLAMLKEFKPKYVIVGHSERRADGETNEQVNKKIVAILASGLTPIVCIGEKERDPEGRYLEFIKNQIQECLGNLQTKDIMDCIIAYEPVWAIGKSYRESMTGNDMHEMSLYLRKVLSEIFGEDYGRNVRILYGGSVEPENAQDLIEKGDIQGFLVGHASLEPEDFGEILRIVEEKK